jgi:hypothetical protein
MDLWMTSSILVIVLLAVLGVLFTARELCRRSAGGWLLPYCWQWGRRGVPGPDEPVHLLLCIADHYEPRGEGASPQLARERVQRWVNDYPRQFGGFRDCDGRPPRHSFFFPIEEYEPEYLDALAELCHAGYGEVEIHLHHDHDTAEGLRARLLAFKEILSERHGLLSRHRETGELAYGFVHGNWALDNARPDGRWCGVNNELDVLRETGCYADFTLPAAPDPSQTRKINSIYYAVDDPLRPKSHDRGIDVGTAPRPDGSLMLIQGPLVLNWSRRKWGIFPRLENACLQGSQLPSLRRLRLWLEARVQVPSRPDWFFVKLHAHGAMEASHDALLGEPMRRFHDSLARHALAHASFHFHYVTAREMYNLARAAENGWTGSVDAARDYELLPNDACAHLASTGAHARRS